MSAEVSDHGDIFNTLINGDPDLILADSDFPGLRLEDSILQIKEDLAESMVAEFTG